jgi:hypothetical protein
VACVHEHLKFKDGSFGIACIDCSQEWQAVKNGQPDFTLKHAPVHAYRETRHDRFVLARTEPEKPIVATRLKKPVK